MKDFFNKHRTGIIHFVGFIIIALSLLFIGWSVTKLDLFDFFNVISKVVNLSIVFAIVVITSTLIIMFAEQKKIRKSQKKLSVDIDSIKKTDQQHFEIAEQNRKLLIEEINNLTSKIHHLTVTVKAIDYNITVKVFNHLDLEKKLFVGLRTINYERIEILDAMFTTFFEKIIKKITAHVRSLKENNKPFTYKAQKAIVDEIEQILLTDNIKISQKNFIELFTTLMKDVIEEKRVDKKKEIADIISDNFKVFIEAIYFEYIYPYKKGMLPIPKKGATKNTNETNNTNNSNINGNDNFALQQIKAENITINIDK